MRLKIWDSHLTCKIANKCLNVREREKVIEWNKRWFPPFLCCPVTLQCPWKKTLIEKKILKSNNSFESAQYKKVEHIYLYICLFEITTHRFFRYTLFHVFPQSSQSCNINSEECGNTWNTVKRKNLSVFISNISNR